MVKEIKGNEIKVFGVIVENLKIGEILEMIFGGVFIYVGLKLYFSMVLELGIMDEIGWVLIDINMKILILGLYVIGDVC